MNYMQTMRIRRALHERLFLLNTDISEDQSQIHLQICGTTLNVYDIQIHNRKIKCNCYDANARPELYCKHICFVYIKIGKNQFDNYLFENDELSSSHITKLLSILNTNELQSSNAINDELTEKFLQLSIKKEEEEKKEEKKEEQVCRNHEDDCPICFTALNEDQIVICMKCENGIHETCMNIWLNKKSTCVFCRSEWKKEMKKKNSKYLNLS